MLDPGGGAKVLPILKFDLETGSPSVLPQYLLRFLLYFCVCLYLYLLLNFGLKTGSPSVLPRYLFSYLLHLVLN